MTAKTELEDVLARLEAAEKVVEASKQLVGMYERASGLPCPPQLRRAITCYDEILAQQGNK